MPIVKCVNCGKDYEILPYRINKSRFCSRKCNTEYRIKHPEEFGGFKEGHEPYGAKPWLGKEFSDDHKKRLSESLKGRLFSDEHKQNLRGDKHWNWKGGKTSINNRIRCRHRRELHEWKMKVLKRDDFTCQICKRNDISVFAHHKVPLSEDNPEKWFDVNNGLTVCRSCHKKLHKEIGEATRFKVKT